MKYSKSLNILESYKYISMLHLAWCVSLVCLLYNSDILDSKFYSFNHSSMITFDVCSISTNISALSHACHLSWRKLFINKIQHFKESFPKTSPKSLLNIFCFKGWFLKDKLFPKCTPHLFNNLAYNSLSCIKITIIYSLCRRHKREAIPCRGMDCYGYYWQSIFGWWIE